MNQPTHFHFLKVTLAFTMLCLYAVSGQAWTTSLRVAPSSNINNNAGNYNNNAMQQCLGLADQERLACYDRLAMLGSNDEDNPATISTTNPWDTAIHDESISMGNTALDFEPTEQTEQTPTAQTAFATEPSILERVWELRADTQDNLFALRPYHTLYMLFGQYSDRVNRQPTSPAPGREIASSTKYRQTEAKFQISIKSKLGHNMLFQNDSLWFGYTQVSQWQIYSSNISRPFRATSYMPEIFYVMPIQQKIPGTSWTWRMASAGLIHESNGRSNPLSRSWNRAYVGLGFDSPSMSIYTRFWTRFPESSSRDDNPHISNYMGRADILFNWSLGKSNTLELKLVSNLRSSNNGSVQLGYYFPLSRLWGMGDYLRGYIQVFHGYGETITDYNFRRNAIGIGVALKEW